MRIFILEDEINQYPRNQLLEVLRGHELTIATSCEEAKQKYQMGKYDLLLLDHDMRGFFEASDYHNTGYQFVSWLINLGEKAGQRAPVILHSQNPTGRKNMFIDLQANSYVVAEYPFSNGYVKWLERRVRK